MITIAQSLTRPKVSKTATRTYLLQGPRCTSHLHRRWHTAPSLSDEPILRRFRVQRVRMPRQRSISNTPANFASILDPLPPLVNERKCSHPENMHVSWTHSEGMTCSAYHDMQRLP
jgi:hypothetical protein